MLRANSRFPLVAGKFHARAYSNGALEQIRLEARGLGNGGFIQHLPWNDKFFKCELSFSHYLKEDGDSVRANEEIACALFRDWEKFGGNQACSSTDRFWIPRNTNHGPLTTSVRDAVTTRRYRGETSS